MTNTKGTFTLSDHKTDREMINRYFPLKVAVVGTETILQHWRTASGAVPRQRQVPPLPPSVSVHLNASNFKLSSRSAQQQHLRAPSRPRFVSPYHSISVINH